MIDIECCSFHLLISEGTTVSLKDLFPSTRYIVRKALLCKMFQMKFYPVGYPVEVCARHSLYANELSKRPKTEVLASKQKNNI